MSIDKETVKYVAELCRIELDAAELEKFPPQLQAIIDFIDKLKRVDTRNVTPTSHILGVTNVLREDAPSEAFSPEEALKNAPQKDGNFFVVPKIIEEA